MTVGTLRTGGEDYRAIATHIVLAQGKLSVDPVSADLPHGHLDGSLSVDADEANPPIHLRLNAPGLALKPLLMALRQPPIATGNVEVYADLDSAGATPNALADALNGSLGIAIPGGTIDNRIVGSILGRLMNDINALDLVGRGGSSDLRCFGARLRAKRGVVTIDALTLNSGLITVTGDGSANFGNETLDLLLKPEARIGGANLVVPVRIAGAMQNPSTKVDRVSSAEANIGSVAGALMGRKNLGGMFGPDRAAGDDCVPALAAARGQVVASEPISSPDLGKALRSLFR